MDCIEPSWNSYDLIKREKSEKKEIKVKYSVISNLTIVIDSILYWTVQEIRQQCKKKCRKFNRLNFAINVFQVAWEQKPSMEMSNVWLSLTKLNIVNSINKIV